MSRWSDHRKFRGRRHARHVEMRKLELELTASRFEQRLARSDRLRQRDRGPRRI